MPSRFALLCATAGLTISAASPAHAWWEYAKWGMTPQQISTASKGAANACAGEEECKAPFKNAAPTMMAAGLEIVGQPARALFDFDDAGKLRATFVVFKSPAINLLNDSLSAKYGPAVNVTRDWPATMTWRDAAKGTLIKSWYLPDSNKIIVEYRPIAKGL